MSNESLKFIEIEYKYNAKDIERANFNSLCKSLGPKRELAVEADTSADYYFSKKDRFMRFRQHKNNWELTTKIKHEDSNNKVRTEINIKLGAGMSPEKAKAFSEVFGLKPDFTIKKDVQIYWFDKVVLSHYTCLSEDGRPLDTFMEIECDESYPWKTTGEALEELAKWEEIFSKVGLTAQKRIRRSLFEIYTIF